MVDLLEYVDKLIALLNTLVRSKSMHLSENSKKRVYRYREIIKELLILKDDINCRVCPPEDIDYAVHTDYLDALDFYFDSICKILVDVNYKELPGERYRDDSIYTSYFGNGKNFPNELTPISIARYSPKGISYKTCSGLTPSAELLKGYKDKSISEEEYTKQFNRQLSNLDANAYGKGLRGHVLVCYEKVGDFCHRNLVAAWLKRAGYYVYELSTEKILDD